VCVCVCVGMSVVSGLGRVSEGGLECFSMRLCERGEIEHKSVDSMLHRCANDLNRANSV